MDRSAAVARIKRGLGFRSDLDNEIADALQEAQREREAGKTAPWFLLKEDQPLSLVGLTNSVNIPSDFWQIGRKEGIKFTPSGTNKTQFIRRYDLGDATGLFGDLGNGPPKAYALRKATLRFFPAADVTYSLTWSYYMHDAVLSTNIENQWLKYAPELLVGDAGLIIAADVRDKEAVAIFQKMQATGLDQAFKETIMRELDDYPVRMGEML
jgi:hypothetical protein